jgi:trimeric autotransporter adhesin
MDSSTRYSSSHGLASSPEHPAAIAARLGALKARLVSSAIANSPDRIRTPSRPSESPVRSRASDDFDVAAMRHRVASLKAALDSGRPVVSLPPRRRSLVEVQIEAERLSPVRADNRRDQHVVYDERGLVHEGRAAGSHTPVGRLDSSARGSESLSQVQQSSSALHARLALFKATLAGGAPISAAPSTPPRGSRSLSPPLQRSHHSSPGRYPPPPMPGAVRLSHARMMLDAPPPAAPQGAGKPPADPLPLRTSGGAAGTPATVPAGAAAPAPAPAASAVNSSAVSAVGTQTGSGGDRPSDAGLLATLERTSILRSESGAAAAAHVEAVAAAAAAASSRQRRLSASSVGRSPDSVSGRSGGSPPRLSSFRPPQASVSRGSRRRSMSPPPSPYRGGPHPSAATASAAAAAAAAEARAAVSRSAVAASVAAAAAATSAFALDSSRSRSPPRQQHAHHNRRGSRGSVPSSPPPSSAVAAASAARVAASEAHISARIAAAAAAGASLRSADSPSRRSLEAYEHRHPQQLQPAAAGAGDATIGRASSNLGGRSSPQPAQRPQEPTARPAPPPSRHVQGVPAHHRSFYDEGMQAQAQHRALATAAPLSQAALRASVRSAKPDHARSPPRAAATTASGGGVAGPTVLLAPHSAVDSSIRSSQHTGVISYLELPVADRDRLDWLLGLMGRYKELQLVYESHYARHARRVLQQLHGGKAPQSTPLASSLTHAAAAAAALGGAWPRDPLIEALRPTASSASSSSRALGSASGPAYASLSRTTTSELEAAVAGLAEVRAGMAAAAAAAAVQQPPQQTGQKVVRRDSVGSSIAPPPPPHSPSPLAEAALSSRRSRSTSRMLRTHSQRAADSVRRSSIASRSTSPQRSPSRRSGGHHSHHRDDLSATASHDGLISRRGSDDLAASQHRSVRSPGRAVASAAAVSAFETARGGGDAGGGVAGPRLSPVRRVTHAPGYTRVTPASSHGPLSGGEVLFPRRR